MKKIIFFISMISIIGYTSISTQEEDQKTILEILRSQEKAWSNHNIDEFMEGYWQNDSLKFYGISGLSYG